MENVLELSNAEIRKAAAARIDRLGLASMKYEDPDTGACCMLGALRVVIFGRTDIWNVIESQPHDEKVMRYNRIVSEVAKDLPEDHLAYDDVIRIGKFNDTNDKETVVRVLAGDE